MKGRKNRRKSKQIWEKGESERWHKRCNRNGLMAESTKRDMFSPKD
jgi:hypothetical protein